MTTRGKMENSITTNETIHVPLLSFRVVVFACAFGGSPRSPRCLLNIACTLRASLSLSLQEEEQWTSRDPFMRLWCVGDIFGAG